MSKKEVTIGSRPSSRPVQEDPDKWVQKRLGSCRLTIDIPASLHGRFKSDCALNGIKMKDVILAYLHNKYPQEPY